MYYKFVSLAASLLAVPPHRGGGGSGGGVGGGGGGVHTPCIPPSPVPRSLLAVCTELKWEKERGREGGIDGRRRKERGREGGWR